MTGCTGRPSWPALSDTQPPTIKPTAAQHGDLSPTEPGRGTQPTLFSSLLAPPPSSENGAVELTWDGLIDQLLRSLGYTTAQCREAVFRAAGGDEGVDVGELAAFVERVANASFRITDDAVHDLARFRSDDEVLEIIITAVAGAASARRVATLAALHGR